MRKPTAKQMRDIRADMVEAVESPGPFQHNLISCTLRSAAAKYGTAVADRLVEEYDLEDLFGIEQEIPRQVGNALSGG